jgi:hypothetical protein
MRQMRVLMLAGVALTAAAALTAVGCASGTGTTPAVEVGAPPPAGHSHVGTLTARGERRATLAVLSGAASVTVTAATMPGQLVRAWTPPNSGVRPQLVIAGGTIQVYLDSTGQGGPDPVLIQVSSAVRWRLQFSGGASQTSVQMGNGMVSGLDFTAGSSLITLTLPRPSGTTLITLAGGASQVSIALPAAVPARLRLYGGASVASLDGQTRSGIAGGTVLTAAGWAARPNRYDVDAPAGVSEISVTG